MLIREQQLEALDSARRREFSEAVVQHVHEAFPDRCAAMGAVETRRKVYAGLDEGLARGFHQGDDLVQFVHLVLLHGDGFAQQPEFEAVLESSASAEERLRRAFGVSKQQQTRGAQRGGVHTLPN